MTVAHFLTLNDVHCHQLSTVKIRVWV